ncbi:thiol:disulfide interchange protein DsbA/DsbL [Aliikangiella marina]|uniref:Thiol:disulfide interchange protein DsbA/DsbL n=1 Tax=Aliikangiella marina TaxID=1712262 RepID=A0A545T4M8_9GAMM|nr:thiol:disulfide interchange protein DsbA/DsbL [Aliikangiella marina]TQV72180.1 thiol:disulfide interchange protein DsbA/DsbL [Aliikangiella marina]
MKQLFGILAIVLLLVGCQGEQDAAQQPAESQEAKQETTQAQAETQAPAEDKHHEADGHDHGSHSAIPSGQAYSEVEPQYACETPVVYEFFAYQCPHCYNLEPEAEKWKKANAGKVKFVSVPTHLGRDQFGSLLLVHHAAVKLGVLDGVQKALFDRIHIEKKLFASPDEAADFLATHGANKEQALTVLADQEAMTAAINKDFEMMAKYKITSVPRVIVNHRYMTDITAAGGTENVFKLVDELLAKEHNCKSGS